MTDKQNIKLYKQKRKSINEIARLNNCSTTKIRTLLIKTNNLETRTNKDYLIYKNKDVHFFDIIDTEAKAYFLGLIITDGCISKTDNNISITLQEKDGYILELFSDFLYKENIVKFVNRQNDTDGKNRQNQRRLIIVSGYIKSKLMEYGITPNKWATAEFPKCHIPDNLFHHFVRGCIDGDGTISVKRKNSQVSLIGSPKFIDTMYSKLISLGFKLHLHEENRPSKPMKFLACYKKKDNKLLCEWLYKNATIFLSRKKPDFNNFDYIYKSYVN